MEAAVEGEEFLGFRLLLTLGFWRLASEADFSAVRCILQGRAGRGGSEKLRAKRQKLQLILLHQVAKRAIGNTQQVGSFGLHSVGLIQRILQQRALDSRNVGFHAYAFRKDRV